MIPLLILMLISCRTTKVIEVPVDKVRIEYRDRIVIDSLIRNDSIIIKEKGDTVFLERYRYIYRNLSTRDTINVTDTITVVQTVEVTKEVNRLHNWQVVLMVLGGAAIALGGYKLFKLIRG